MLKYGCILMQNCPCLYFNEGNENFLSLLPFTSCASWNERGDPSQLQSLMSPKIIATKQPGCGDAPSVLTHSSRSLQSQDLASMCWEGKWFVLLEEISLLPLQHSSSSVIIPTMKFIKITASLLISKFFPNFLLGVLGAWAAEVAF